MTLTYYVSWLHSFDTLRIQLSRDLLSLDILIFVKIIKEMILRVALWNTNAEGICDTKRPGSYNEGYFEQMKKRLHNMKITALCSL